MHSQPQQQRHEQEIQAQAQDRGARTSSGREAQRRNTGCDRHVSSELGQLRAHLSAGGCGRGRRGGRRVGGRGGEGVCAGACLDGPAAVADVRPAHLHPAVLHPDLAALPITPTHLASERGQSGSAGGETVAVVAMVAQGYDLDPRLAHGLRCLRGEGTNDGCVGGEPPDTWARVRKRLGLAVGQEVVALGLMSAWGPRQSSSTSRTASLKGDAHHC